MLSSRSPVTRPASPTSATPLPARPLELIAHRGAPRERRENTVPSFVRALEHGADGIELDVHFSVDGVPVVHHDATLGPGASAHAGTPLASLDAATLGAIRIHGEATVPLLSEVMAAVAGRATLYVEVKARADARELDALHATFAGPGAVPRLAVHSFDHRVARLSASRWPDVPTGILSESYLVDTVAALRAAGARDLWQHWSQVDAALVVDVHAAGGRVVVWTVNDPDRARALAALGVDALCTDDVPLLRSAVPTTGPL